MSFPGGKGRIRFPPLKDKDYHKFQKHNFALIDFFCFIKALQTKGKTKDVSQFSHLTCQGFVKY